MRPIVRLTRGRKASLTFGGTGHWEQPPFWSLGGAGRTEDIEANFAGYAEGAYRANGVVFTCILIRALTFSEVRFAFQRLQGGRPTELWGDASLSLLEEPWPNGTTGELLYRMEQDASLAGNFYAVAIDDRGRFGPAARAEDGRRIRRLRPDWVTIVTGVPGKRPEDSHPWDLHAKVVGYVYHPREGADRPDPVLLTPDQVVHWSPIPDPLAQWRGMSWITPIVREIKGDIAASEHKLKYFEHGATGGIAITYDAAVEQDVVERYAAMWAEAHEGKDNAYKTFHLGGGATAETIGSDLKQLDFKATQGAGETRIAAAAGVGAVIAQLSEGMQGSSLNAGNFVAARRRFADITMRPQWRSACAALRPFAPPPSGSRLWYDARDVSFLQEDEKDAAEILSIQAATIARLSDAGFSPDEVVRAVADGDLRSLTGQHSGLFSVQLQPAGEPEPGQGGPDGP